MVSRTRRFAYHDPDALCIARQIGLVNAQRFSRLFWILVLIHLAHLAIFWPYTPGASDNEHLWRNGVLAIHGGMLLLLAAMRIGKQWLDRTGRLAPAAWSWLMEVLALAYLFLGAGLAIVDQRVTAAITPLLAASTGVAVAIVVRPAVAALHYALVLAFFLTGVAWTQTQADLLLTVRVNSLTAMGLGFGLALLQYRNQVVTIRQQNRIEEQQRELEAKNQTLTRLATRDPMTGVLNRAQFMVEAERQVAGRQETACLIMMDVDHFKRINDTYGHPAGDRILTEAAQLMARLLRGTDLLARFGGEEFAILLPGTSLEEGLAVAESLRIAVALQPFSFGGDPIHVTASFGVAAVTAGMDLGYLAADAALYRAKGDGRNCVRFARSPGQSTATDAV
ncbi:MAG TPA: diguanylate cyclase [Symbiobacteriaceae bacterium]|nr:diguanylate cyclase [Symbiobacteriaceae bacterium]